MRNSRSIATKRILTACDEVVLAGLVLVAVTSLSSDAAAASVDRAAGKGSVDFSRDILPILSDNCFQCHGPDEKARKGKLRLDTKEGAFRLKDGKTVIVPGKSAESELVRRVTSSDPEEVMPPPKSNRKLTATQIGLLRRWVEEGAKWGVHWAFLPPARSKLPKTKLSSWARN